MFQSIVSIAPFALVTVVDSVELSDVMSTSPFALLVASPKLIRSPSVSCHSSGTSIATDSPLIRVVKVSPSSVSNGLDDSLRLRLRRSSPFSEARESEPYTMSSIVFRASRYSVITGVELIVNVAPCPAELSALILLNTVPLPFL